MRICKKCLMVEGWRGYGDSCFGSPHVPVEAVVVDCPFLERTTKGRVTHRRIEAADRDCLQASTAISETHHYGDPDRRHIMTPNDAIEFEEAMVRARRIDELKHELATLEST